MSDAKKLSGLLIEQSEKNPRMAFLLIPLGGLLIWFGVSDAKRYLSLRDRPTRHMKVDEVYTAPNHRGFPAPHVKGQTPDGEVSFAISPQAARRIQPGQDLGFVPTDDKNIPFMPRDMLDSQLSSIYFSVVGFPINHISLLGAIVAIIGLCWGLFGKAKAPETGEPPKASDSRRFWSWQTRPK